MKKAVKGILGLTALLAALGGGYAALRLSEPTGENIVNSSETSTEATKKEVVLIKDVNVTATNPETGSEEMGVVESVDVVNATETLHVVHSGTIPDSTAPRYVFSSYENVPMDYAVIGTLANNANGLTSNDVIEENCTDMSKFGLDPPAITVDVKFETGYESKLLIGNETPKGAENYVAVEGSNTVYTVTSSRLANYSKTLFDFADKTILAEPSQDEYPGISSLRIQREDLDYDIYIAHNEKTDDPDYQSGTISTQLMLEPVEANLAVERSTEITNGMFGLYASGIYSLRCKESDIAEAGLKDPFCTVEMKTDDGGDYVLYLSEPFTDGDGKSCYAMMKDGKIIYIVNADDAKWVSVMPIDIASKIFIGEYVWNISELSIKCDGVDDKFIIKAKEPNAEVDTRTSENYITTLNGKEFDSERYRLFYSFLISANAEEFAVNVDKPDAEPMAVLEYTESYSNKTKKLEFYDYSNMTALVVVDGQSRYFVTKSYVETMIDNAKRIETGEDYVTTWR